MRSLEEHEGVMVLVEEGLNDCEVARRTAIPRSTIRDWRRGATSTSRERRKEGAGARPCCGGCGVQEDMEELGEPYAYLLGQYLGDGTISMLRRGVARLRLACAEVYPSIVTEVAEAIRSTRPDNSVYFASRPGVIEVSALWKHWPCAFPQHGPGMKHQREIRLADWQERIRYRHPEPLLRGLIHSDGCRHINTIVRRLKDGPKTYRYVRYVFTNESDDIRRIVTDTFDLLGVHWTRMNRRNVSVARRADVAALDRFIGPKT